MSTPLLLVMGNQLYPTHKVGLMEGSTARRRGYAELGPAPLPVFMAEEPARCRQFRCHTHKLLLILSSMRSHRDFLTGRHELYYYTLEDTRSYFEKLQDAVRHARPDALVAYEPDDRRLEKQLTEYAARLGLPLSFRPSKSFLMSGKEVREKLRESPEEPAATKREPRETTGKPREELAEPGEEQKAFPENIRFLPLPRADWTDHTRRLAGEISKMFPDNPGDPADFFLPTSRGQALKWLDSFLQYRLVHFGEYQSAIHQSELLGFHSLLSPLLNIGLLFPGEVVEAAQQRNVSASSREGFIRRIIDTREMQRGMYLTRALDKAGKEIFQGHRRLGEAWYSGTTGLPIVDDSIKKVLRYGYVHHRERLMVLAVMHMCEVHPEEVYRWFSELFVDAHDWVTIPNLYGIEIFDSNYLLKISNYAKGPWCDTVDGLYRRFVDRHRYLSESKSESRSGASSEIHKRVNLLDRMSPGRFKRLHAAAEEFIRSTTK